MIFTRKPKKFETPYGEGHYIGSDVSVPWVRWKGVLVDLQWPKDSTPNDALVRMIRDELDSLTEAAMSRIGIQEFPPELRTMVPDAVSLHPSEEDGNWSLTFRCAEWDDGIWGVIFNDREIVRDYNGD